MLKRKEKRNPNVVLPNSEEEKLLGDHIEDFLKTIGADKLAEAYEDITGSDCGCDKRKEKLNKLHKRLKNRNV